MKRTAFIGSGALGVATLAIAPTTATATGAADVPGGTHLVEPLTSFDKSSFDRLVGRPAEYRIVWEAVAYVPSLLNNVKNSMNGLEFGYGTNRVQISIAVAGHGPSSVYTYSDYVWTKYRIGEFFGIKDASGSTITSNVFLARTSTSSKEPNDEHGLYQDTSVRALQDRGVTFMTCHTAVEEQSRALVKRGFAPAGVSANDVAADILTHLIPGAVVVPSMVATIAYLQTKFHYAYLTVQ